MSGESGYNIMCVEGSAERRRGEAVWRGGVERRCEEAVWKCGVERWCGEAA